MEPHRALNDGGWLRQGWGRLLAQWKIKGNFRTIIQCDLVNREHFEILPNFFLVGAFFFHC